MNVADKNEIGQTQLHFFLICEICLIGSHLINTQLLIACSDAFTLKCLPSFLLHLFMIQSLSEILVILNANRGQLIYYA